MYQMPNYHFYKVNSKTTSASHNLLFSFDEPIKQQNSEIVDFIKKKLFSSLADFCQKIKNAKEHQEQSSGDGCVVHVFLALELLLVFLMFLHNFSL